jgi:intracellular multiplication protein IcmO
MSDEIRGLEARHEHSAQSLARDTRPLGERFAAFLEQPATIFVSSLSGISMCMIFPEFADLTTIVCTALFMFAYTRKNSLPFKMPKSSNALDYNDLLPNSYNPRKSQGIAFFGNERNTNEELWFSNEDLRTHVLIFGSTGSGKTEFLVSLAYNSLVQGSGFIYIDGKGDNSLFAKIFSMVRAVGRDDDMLLINFMTGARDIIGPQETRLSNTMNPFSQGSSSMVTQLLVSLMDSGGEGGNGDMWKGRAINFVESLMRILCYMRDQGHLLLDANVIREYFLLERLETIVVDKKFPLLNSDYKVDISNAPAVVTDPIKSYVVNLPGYNMRNKGRQAGEVLEQHGFITMQLTRSLGSLADAYGHIIRTNLAEVDFKDVVLNRRVLVVLLPALEKSPDELANLGKIIVASLKAMMASGLGDTVEGDYRDVIQRKPTTSSSPYVCIMDEYGYYAVKGFAVVPAQARSLGFAAIFAGQDLPAFQKASKEEAASIGANCNIKICMKLEDPQETWEYFNKVAGETYVTNVSGFQQNSGSISVDYMDTRSTSVDRRQRIELLDLRDQRQGQSHIFFKSSIIRAQVFFADPKPVKSMRITQFLKVETPPQEMLSEMANRLVKFNEILVNNNYKIPKITSSDDVVVLENAFGKATKNNLIERGVAALVKVLEFEAAKQREMNQTAEEDDDFENQISAFSKITIDTLIKKIIGNEDKELFSLPLIRRGATIEEIKNIERICGKNNKDANDIAMQIVKDIEDITKFPPQNNMMNGKDKKKFIDSLNTFILLMGGQSYPGQQVPNESNLLPKEEVLEKYKIPELPQLPSLDELEKIFRSRSSEQYFASNEHEHDDDEDEHDEDYHYEESLEDSDDVNQNAESHDETEQDQAIQSESQDEITQDESSEEATQEETTQDQASEEESQDEAAKDESSEEESQDEAAQDESSEEQAQDEAAQDESIEEESQDESIEEESQDESIEEESQDEETSKDTANENLQHKEVPDEQKDEDDDSTE